MSKQRIMLMVGASLLVLAPLIFFFYPTASSDVEEPTIDPPTDREEVIISRLVQDLQRGEFGEARQIYEDGLASAERLTGAHYQRILTALQAGQQKAYSKSGLLLYGQLLSSMARLRIQIPNFAFHCRRLRHQALTLDARQELYLATAFRLMEYEGLVDYEPEMLPDVIDYCVIFGSRHSDEDRRTYWSRAIDHLPELLDRERRSPSRRFDVRYHPLRTLARVAAASGSPRAMALFEKILGSLGDGSPQSVAEFERWFTHAMPDVERGWSGNADASEYYGYESEIADALRNWLIGVYRMYLPGTGHNRGAARIRMALEGLDFGAHYLFRLDLAEALRAEANVLESSLHDASLVVGQDRIRELHDVGWGALRLGYVDDVQEIIQRLAEHTISPEVLTIRGLFEGALHVLSGDAEEGFDIIGRRVVENFEILDPETVARWRQVAAERVLPAAEPADSGQILMQLGVLWDDMREQARLEQALSRLRGEQARRRDRYYLEYLEAIVRYRKSEVAGLSERLLALLDQEEPPGVSRGEVAALAYAVDRRVEDVGRIQERRREVIEELVPAVIRGVPDRSGATLLAQSLGWQVRMDATRGEYLSTTEGRETLEAIKEALDTGGDLGFALEERWLDLKDGLLDLTHRYRDEGDLVRASRVLELTSELIKNRPRFHHEQAMIFELQAEQVHPADEEEKRQAWLLTAEAYSAAASSEFGNPELFYDAAQAFAHAEEFPRAFEAIDQYDADRTTPVFGEARYWGKKVLLSRIYRELELPEKTIELYDEISDHYGARVHLPRLLEQRAAAFEDLGRPDEALKTYESMLEEQLDSFSTDYVAGLYHKARLLQAKKNRAATSKSLDDGEKKAAIDASRLAWSEIAAKIRTDRADPRLAEALYFLGVDAVERQAFPEAQRILGRLARAGAIADEVRLPAAARAAWNEYGDRGAHVLADSYFFEGDFREAARRYRSAIERNPDSREIAWAFLQQGLCHVRLRENEEAGRVLRLGRQRVDEIAPDQLDAPGRSKAFWLERFDQTLRDLPGGP